MEPLPHDYSVVASGEATGDVVVSGSGLSSLRTGPPLQFGGPGGQWSPETLLIAAAADCFILTFRAVARASNLSWTALRCTAEGRLDRVDGITRFTKLIVRALLTIAPGADAAKARRLLEKAAEACLITNSLALIPTLTCEIETTQSEVLTAEDRGEAPAETPR